MPLKELRLGQAAVSTVVGSSAGGGVWSKGKYRREEARYNFTFDRWVNLIALCCRILAMPGAETCRQACVALPGSELCRQQSLQSPTNILNLCTVSLYLNPNRRSERSHCCPPPP